MPLYPEDPATIAYSHEPRSLRVPSEPIPAGQSIGVGVPMIPARLNGINGIDVSSSGRQYTIGLDIESLPIAPGLPASQWLAVWVEGTPVDAIGRVAVNAIPADAPANGITYGRKDHDWVDITTLSVEWDNITDKPATFPPSSHTHPTSDIIGLDTALANIDDTNEAQDASIAALEVIASAAIGDAPADGETYGRKDNLWTVIEDTGGTGTVEIGDSAPSVPIDRTWWWESDTGYLFLRFPNGGEPTWVQVNGIGDAPVDGTAYNRRNGAWVAAASGGTSDWASITGKPTTISGYGITDAYTKTEVDAAVDSSIGGGMLGFFDYTFNSTNYVAPPIAGNFRMNNATQTSVTHIFVHEQTAPGNDAALMLAQIAVGDKLLIQKKTDATKWKRYTVTAASDAGTYWDFTVTYVDGAGVLDTARTAIVVQKAGGGGGIAEAPTDGALYYRRGSTNAWVKATVSASAPSGGSDGDIWYVVP